MLDGVVRVGKTALPTYTDPDLEAKRASCGTSECRYSHGSHRGSKVWDDPPTRKVSEKIRILGHREGNRL